MTSETDEPAGDRPADSWLGSALGVPAVPLGIDGFGQSGSVRELSELHGLVPDAIAGAAEAALALVGH